MSPKKGTSDQSYSNKTRVELRLDNDVFERIKALADEAKISVNQLIGGLTRWGSMTLRVGEPGKRENGYIYGSKSQEGCLWAGETGGKQLIAMTERKRIQKEIGFDPGEDEDDLSRPGKVFCFLDFTERRVVREDD